MRTLSSLTLSVALASSMLTPLMAHAYLTPDQVFGGSDTVTAPPPPTQREGEAVVQKQQQAAASSREAAQNQLVPNYAEPVDTYVPPQVASSKGLFDQNAQYQVRQDRIQEQETTSPTIIIGGNGDVVDGNGNVLHSGAPRVSSTGPATVLAGISMMLSTLCTFAFVHMRSRKIATFA